MTAGTTPINVSLNKELTALLGVDLSGVSDQRFMTMGFPDYCTNWNALMPVALKHKVSLKTNVDSNVYVATAHSSLADVTTKDAIFMDEPPQIAVIKCLIDTLKKSKD